MKTVTILKTDFLDILFHNKNKEYGAYPLRKFYNNRLKKALGITTSLVLVFAGLQSWKTPHKKIDLTVSDPIELSSFPDKKIEDIKPLEKIKVHAKPNVATVQNTTIVIVKTPITTVPNIKQIDTSAIGTANSTGNGVGTTINVGNGDSIPTATTGIKTINTTTETDEPIYNPGIMPQFPGGVEALRNFMLQNLKQPDDINEGEKIVVLVKFVINKLGNISDVEIIESGRSDLDNEVMRVINKMPTWKPGSQNGYPVAVYFKMPITFVNNN